MRLRSIFMAPALVGVAVAGAVGARAQGIDVGQRNSISAKPSERVGDRSGPSVGTAAPTPTRRASSSASTPGSGLGGFSNFSRRSQYGGASGTPTGYGDRSLIGTSRGSRSRGIGSLVEIPTTSISTLAHLSGFTAATSLGTPEGGWDLRPPSLNSPIVPIATNSERTPFQNFFGLSAPEPAASDVEAIHATMGEAMASDNVRRVERMELRARELFRAAVTGPESERLDTLARAMRLMRAVRDLDAQAYLPSLLMFHAALEREQTSVAVTSLFDVVKRNPTVFQERPDLAQFFGDAEALRKQMRRFRLIGDLNPTSPEAFVIEAYCAWSLDDITRQRQALAKAVELSKSDDSANDIAALKFAMEAARP